MKIEFNISEKELKEDLTKRLAKLIWKGEMDGMIRSFGFGHELEEIMKKKAHKLLAMDKEFDKIITKQMKRDFNDKNLRKRIVSEIIKEKLERDY